MEVSFVCSLLPIFEARNQFGIFRNINSFRKIVGKWNICLIFEVEKLHTLPAGKSPRG